jgi:hypothetical protein
MILLGGEYWPGLAKGIDDTIDHVVEIVQAEQQRQR